MFPVFYSSTVAEAWPATQAVCTGFISALQWEGPSAFTVTDGQHCVVTCVGRFAPTPVLSARWNPGVFCFCLLHPLPLGTQEARICLSFTYRNAWPRSLAKYLNWIVRPGSLCAVVFADGGASSCSGLGTVYVRLRRAASLVYLGFASRHFLRCKNVRWTRKNRNC